MQIGLHLGGLLAYMPDWMDDAACADQSSTKFFTRDEPRARESDLKEGLAICRTCPVRSECLDFALEMNCKHGLWGGYTSRERQRMRRQRSGLSLLNL